MKINYILEALNVGAIQDEDDPVLLKLEALIATLSASSLLADSIASLQAIEPGPDTFENCLRFFQKMATDLQQPSPRLFPLLRKRLSRASSCQDYGNVLL